MSEILSNTGVKLWSETDYNELWLTIFDQLTGQGGKSNIRLIDEAIGKINVALDGYKFEFSSDEDRLYISKGDSKLPVSLIDSNGHVATKVDGTTITIDENGVIKGVPVDDALSEESTNPLQNKVITGELKSIKSKMGTDESAIKQNTSDITSNTKRIEANERAISTLNGTGDGSVKKAVSDGIAEVVAGAPEDFDTLKEMSDWIDSHESSASAMNSQIQNNKKAIDNHALNGDVHVTPENKTNWNKVSEKLDKTGDASNVTTEFTTATTRSNLTTKEKLSTSLGKIAKWFSDLKTVAFSGSYNDLSDKPIVDANISSTSTNPVQNKVVKNALDHKLNGYTVTYTVPANTGGWHKIAQISDYFNFDLYAGGGWFSASKSIAHFQIQNIHGKIRIVQLSGKVLPNANNGIAKIRMVRVSDDVDTWILEEYSPSSINPEVYTFTMAGSLKLTPLDGSVDSTTSFKDSVVLDVLDIPTGHVITTGSVDSAMSDTSEHPVQNKVIKAYVDKKASENVDFSTSTSKLLNDSIEAPMLVTNATKNLFDARILNTTPTSVSSNTKYSVSEGSITVSAVSKNTAFVQVYWRVPIEKFGLSAGDKVFFSIEIDTSGANINGEQRVYLYQMSNENDGSKKVILIPGKEQGKLDLIDDTDIILLFRLNQNTDYNEVGQFFTVKNIQIEKSSAVTNYVPYDGYEIKSCGKNLVTPTYATITLNGITCTNNGDGTYTFNGTATDSIFFNINKNISINKGTKYKVVCFKDEDYIQNKITSCVRRVDTTAEYVFDNGTFVSDAENCWLWIRIVKGVTVSNLVAKPIITTDLDATYDDFEPYKDGGTVQITPSTEFPLLGLKSFDGETNIISPGNVEVTYAKSDSGAAIVDTLKKSVSDGKTKVANAITGKGVKTATDATFDVMAENISKIDTEAHGATLSVVTSDKELFGKTVTLTLKDGSTGSQRKTVFSSNGKCSFVVQKPGTYTVACGADAHEDVTVTSDNVLNKTTMVVALVVLKIVTFANGTDEEIAKMIQAHYNNKINIADYWAVGDTRSVSLSAMSSAMVGESHRAQTVQFVIADFEHDTLASGIGPHSKAAITLLQKDCLMDAANASNPSANGSNNTENGYMSSRQSNEGGWDACSRRGWCNNIYFNALPTAWRSMVKTVNKKTSVGNNSSTIETVQDKIFLPSEIEIFGSTIYSFAGEGAQYQYYKNAKANRYKDPRWTSTYVSSMYFTRSPNNNTTSYCIVNASGNANTRYADTTAGIAPMMCV